jgi:hypothetical protein
LEYASPAKDNTNALLLQQSLLWKYHASLGVWRCPGEKSTSRHGGRDIPRVRSVSMNCFLNGDVDTPYRDAKKTSDLVRPGPSDTWVLIDEREDSINNASFGTQWKSGIDPWIGSMASIWNWPAAYHHRAGALTFVDGHSEIHRWRDDRTIPPIIKGVELQFGVPSPDNDDMHWLTQQATARNRSRVRFLNSRINRNRPIPLTVSSAKPAYIPISLGPRRPRPRIVGFSAPPIRVVAQDHLPTIVPADHMVPGRESARFREQGPVASVARRLGSGGGRGHDIRPIGKTAPFQTSPQNASQLFLSLLPASAEGTR